MGCQRNSSGGLGGGWQSLPVTRRMKVGRPASMERMGRRGGWPWVVEVGSKLGAAASLGRQQWRNDGGYAGSEEGGTRASGEEGGTMVGGHGGRQPDNREGEGADGSVDEGGREEMELTILAMADGGGVGWILDRRRRWQRHRGRHGRQLGGEKMMAGALVERGDATEVVVAQPLGGGVNGGLRLGWRISVERRCRQSAAQECGGGRRRGLAVRVATSPAACAAASFGWHSDRWWGSSGGGDLQRAVGGGGQRDGGRQHGLREREMSVGP